MELLDPGGSGVFYPFFKRADTKPKKIVQKSAHYYIQSCSINPYIQCKQAPYIADLANPYVSIGRCLKEVSIIANAHV